MLHNSGIRIRSLLLISKPSLLPLRATPELILGLPRRASNERNARRVGKDGFDVFEGLAGCLGEHEEHVQTHGCAEDAEDDVDFPGDVGEGGRDEVAERKVEGPVGGGAEGVGFAADAEGEQLGRVDPADGAPGDGVGAVGVSFLFFLFYFFSMDWSGGV